jgi:peptidoglycan/LPS O-acetylase OafA/YrhL
MRYRRDVDGLRAVAVVSVVLFHAKVKGFTGGFVGVDIFFVISGFLITRLIYEEARSGTFSILSFYERRVRRIIPALAVVIAGVTVGSLSILYASDLKLYGQSVIATMLFSSNLLFWNEAGYFTAGSKPLLHTWSLAVEEQFYILFPFLIALATRRARRWLVPAIITAGLVSFVSCVWTVARYPTAAFYLSPFRAWEFLIGSLLAVRAVPLLRNALLREAAGAAGLAMIMWAVITYSEYIRFPGLRALPPCVGSALVIYSGDRDTTAVSHALGWKPIVLIGLISYSLYLWHWPILQFARYNSPVDLGAGTTAFCIAIAFLFAWLSWQYVEQPVRRRTVLQGRRRIFGAVGCQVSIACATGALLVTSHGMSWIYPSEARRILAYARYAYSGPYREHRCFLAPEDTFAVFDKKECATPKAESKNYILIGDSYAAHLWFGLASELPVHVMEAAASLCRPILDGSEPYPACGPLKNYALEQGIKTADAILLAANWKDNELERLGSTIAFLHNHSAAKIVVFGPIVQYMHPLPDVLGMAIAEGRPDIPTRDQQPGVPVIRLQDGRMREVTVRNGGSYISIVDTICPGGSCRVMTPGQVPLQWDQAHLTAEGSQWLAATWRATGLLP